jgi:hypothetical protein
MKRAIARPLLIVSVFALASVSTPAAQKPRTFVGVITDDMCATDGHASMRMGPTDAECTKACVAAHGAEYVLTEGKQIYTLSDQKTPEKFAGQKVRVTGTLDDKTKKIQIVSMTLDR